MGVVCGKQSIIKKKEKDGNNKTDDNTNINTVKSNNSLENKSTTDKKEEPPDEKKKKQKNEPKMVVSIDPNVIVTKGIKNPREIYLREKALGQGSFGTVYLVKHLQLQRYYAMKVIKKKTKTAAEEESLMNEINILRKLDHPNILKITDLQNIVKKENYLMK